MVLSVACSPNTVTFTSGGIGGLVRAERKAIGICAFLELSGPSLQLPTRNLTTSRMKSLPDIPLSGRDTGRSADGSPWP